MDSVCQQLAYGLQLFQRPSVSRGLPNLVALEGKGYRKVHGSLRSMCESAQARGHRSLRIKYDAFCWRFRHQEETDRLITIDSEAYAAKMKVVSDFAAGYGRFLR